MSLQYLLDGYNVIHKIPGLADRKLETQRSELVRYIELNAPQGNNAVTIVFDGQLDVYSPAVISKVKVIYSKGEIADDKIKRMVRESKQAKNIVVVTNDRDIQYAVGAAGAKVCTVEDFLKKKSSGSAQVDAPISRIQKDQITDEMKDIWLKDSE